METAKTSWAWVVLALVIGLVGGYYLSNRGEATIGMHRMPDGTFMMNSGSMSQTMGSMMMGLDGKTGDAFDIAFLEEMIVHHQGAVEMAEAALQNAKHQEIKTMAQAIISAQTAEIAQMKSWLASWYGK